MSRTTCVFGVSAVSVRLADLLGRPAIVVGVSVLLPRFGESR
jgi:hypothetical protein